ncbi:hypothetical protein RJ641_004408 [Dillenia turbinata]|uniref:Uncharacterized protein n=1 Tax=Dillenia turbinata TaxID=194707 RepID=A0AAN8Z877_9MAGN
MTSSSGIRPRCSDKRTAIQGRIVQNQNSVAYDRTPEEILRIVYGSGNESVPGGFYPKGGDGKIAKSHLKVCNRDGPSYMGLEVKYELIYESNFGLETNWTSVHILSRPFNNVGDQATMLIRPIFPAMFFKLELRPHKGHYCLKHAQQACSRYLATQNMGSKSAQTKGPYMTFPIGYSRLGTLPGVLQLKIAHICDIPARYPSCMRSQESQFSQGKRTNSLRRTCKVRLNHWPSVKKLSKRCPTKVIGIPHVPPKRIIETSSKGAPPLTNETQIMKGIDTLYKKLQLNWFAETKIKYMQNVLVIPNHGLEVSGATNCYKSENIKSSVIRGIISNTIDRKYKRTAIAIAATILCIKRLLSFVGTNAVFNELGINPSCKYWDNPKHKRYLQSRLKQINITQKRKFSIDIPNRWWNSGVHVSASNSAKHKVS